MATEAGTRVSRKRRVVFVLLAVCLVTAAVAAGSRLLSPTTEPPCVIYSRHPGGPADAVQSFKPFAFIHAGDPQIGAWSDVKNTEARFAELGHIADEMGVALVVVVGDLVSSATNPKLLGAYDEAASEFQMPIIAIPGNHDNLVAFHEHIGKDHFCFTYNNCDFVCLNSNLFLPSLSADKKELADAQWQWLEQTLKSSREHDRAHIFLVMHHPLAALHFVHQRLEDLIRKYNVEVVLAGHRHMTRQYKHEGFAEFIVSGTGYTTDRKGLGYRLFKVYYDRIEQEYRTLDQPIPKITLTR